MKHQSYLNSCKVLILLHLGSSLVAFATGIGLGYIFYIGRWVDPVKFINSNIVFYCNSQIFLKQMVS